MVCHRFHYNCTVLRRVFEGWRDEWWTSRREWILMVRADCHYRSLPHVTLDWNIIHLQELTVYICFRFILLAKTLHRWRVFTSLQREKKTKMQKVQSLGIFSHKERESVLQVWGVSLAALFVWSADGRRMRWVWDEWKVFIELRRTHRLMLESALEHRRLPKWVLVVFSYPTLSLLNFSGVNSVEFFSSAWCLWQMRLQQQEELHILEDQALKQGAVRLQTKVNIVHIKW